MRSLRLDGAASGVAERLGATRVGISGEVYGQGVQDLADGVSARSGVPGHAAFDVCGEADGRVRWLDPVPLVPRLFEGPSSATPA